jgi:adenine specific DNA methylase Mod
MQERMIELHRVLKDTGTIYLHCDWHAGHYLKVMMDDVFGNKKLPERDHLAL